jgi:hypothetical protein
MPSKNRERLKNKLTAVNIPLSQRTIPWLIVTKERIQNAMYPRNMSRPEGLNKSEIVQLLIQLCCDRRTLFDADGKLKSTIELRKMLSYWQSFAYRASVEGPLWSSWIPPESWENLTPPPSWHEHVAECERKYGPDKNMHGPPYLLGKISTLEEAKQGLKLNLYHQD